MKMETLGDDLLVGAAAIAAFLFKNPKKRRKVYRLHQRKLIPTFKIGPELASRKSTLLHHIAKQERDAATETTTT
jgi:hypothetical protein